MITLITSTGSCVYRKNGLINQTVCFLFWGAMWESNPRIPEPQSGVLTTSPITPCKLYYTLSLFKNQ